jgi:16S rRNA (guanine527-N7)-methyltransferase
VTPAQQEQLEELADLLRSAPLNLLSPRDRELVWQRHVGESQRVCEVLRPRPGTRWIDIGTGGGLPGLVFAILCPDTRFSLVDARKKKIAAVESFVHTLDLQNVDVFAARAEVLARDEAHRGSYDGASSRALGRLATVIELSRGFLRDGAHLAAIRGGRVVEELDEIRSALPKFAVADVRHQPIIGTDRETWLVTMRAQGRVPQALPRSDGLPASRPLGWA